MSNDRWWRLQTEPRRARFSLLGRGKTQPERLLRIANMTPIPDPVEVMRFSEQGPREVAWLFRSGKERPGRAFNIHIGVHVERVPERHSAQPDVESVAARSGGIAPPRQPGTRTQAPSIADRLRAALLVPLDRLLPGADSILEWPAALMQYQKEGVHALLDKHRILLADDMGLGKTVQAIAAIRILCQHRAIERTLLIVPASLIDQWRREFARWAPELRVIPVRGLSQDRAWQWNASAHVTMVSYETFRSDFLGSSPSGAVRRIWDLVVLDEAQKIKNRGSDISRQVKHLRRLRSWAMTGTPLENKVDDLASILEFVDHTDDGASRTYAPSNALLQRHRELQLRRRKADVLGELPPKQIITIRIPLLPRQRVAYERAEREGIVQLRAQGASIRIEHILELITRLKQLCNRDPASGESSKLEDIHERLHMLTDEGHRALLFSQYTDENFGVGAAARYLAAFDPLSYTGSLSSAARDAVIQGFKGDVSHRALILSLRAGGVGLNLQEASYVFHIDRWWNPAVERQAEDRTHRLGQIYPVTVFKYTCLDTIEERIEQILSEKQQLFDDIVDDVSLNIATRLTRNDLFGMFDLDVPETATTPGRSRRNGLGLEERCEAILEARGWDVQRTPLSRGGGIDLLATRVDEVGLEQTICMHCQDRARPVGVEVISALLGALPIGGNARPVVAAPSGMTADATALATQRNVVIWDDAVLRRLENQDPFLHREEQPGDRNTSD